MIRLTKREVVGDLVDKRHHFILDQRTDNPLHFQHDRCNADSNMFSYGIFSHKFGYERKVFGGYETINGVGREREFVFVNVFIASAAQDSIEFIFKRIPSI